MIVLWWMFGLLLAWIWLDRLRDGFKFIAPSFRDLDRVARLGAADLVNVKLAKCGGVGPAARMPGRHSRGCPGLRPWLLLCLRQSCPKFFQSLLYSADVFRRPHEFETI